jgi:NAD(P)-dependent dehydrogenase (short-subunit alcohol dehydrogenase family)
MTAPGAALVTGASSGIGRAVSERLADQGRRLVLVARGREALEEVAGSCLARGAETVDVEPADVGDDAAVSALLGRTRDRHGRLETCVHAAGVVAYGRLDVVPVEVFDGVVRSNLLGTANVARHVLPVMREQDGGSLVLVGSVLGHLGVPGMTPYVVSKWAVRGLARQLQLENRDRPGVRVSYVEVGSVDTPIYENAGNYLGVQGRPPFPVGSPEHVADVILRRLGRKHISVGWANGVMRFGFTALPAVYDALVGPLFDLAASDPGRPVPAGPGNVLASVVGSQSLRGGLGGSVSAVGRNVRRRLVG